MFRYYSREEPLVSNLRRRHSSPLLAEPFAVGSYSRVLLSKLLTSEEIIQGSRVLLPDYICNTVVDAVRQTGAEVDFYPIDCRAGLPFSEKALEERIGPNTRAVVVVDYFGVPVTISAGLRNRLKEKKILHIRDAAHSFLTLLETPQTLAESDVTFTSPYKVLPCYVGAMLFSRKGILFTSDISPVDLLQRLARVEGKRSLGLLHSSWVLRSTDRLTQRPCATHALDSGYPLATHTWFSLLRRLNFGSIIKRRRQLVSQYDLLFTNLSGIEPLFPVNLRRDASLMVYPLLFGNQAKRDRWLNRLVDRGVDAFSWPTFSLLGRNEEVWSRLLLLPLVKDLTPILQRMIEEGDHVSVR